MDKLKQKIADEVRDSVHGIARRLYLPEVPIAEAKAEGSGGSLATLIQVKTMKEGTRYFEVRVKEVM